MREAQAFPYDIVIVGLGIVGVQQVTREVEETLRRCPRTFVADLTPGVLDYVRELSPEVVDLTSRFQPEAHRARNYQTIAGDVVAAAGGNVRGLVQPDNAGPAAARNRGFAAAEGRLGVVIAADAGDQPALAARFGCAGEDLAALAVAAARHLYAADDAPVVAMSGGVWGAGAVIEAPFTEAVRRVYAGARFRPQVWRPAIGVARRVLEEEASP